MIALRSGSVAMMWWGASVVGIVFAGLSFPLVIGAEELTRWSTVTLTNATAGNFLRALAVVYFGSIYADKYKKHWWNWLILVGGVIAGLALLWWEMNFVNLFNVL